MRTLLLAVFVFAAVPAFAGAPAAPVASDAGDPVLEQAVDQAVDQALGLHLESELASDGACQAPRRRNRNRNRNRNRSSGGQAGGSFGLGIQLGWPTGLAGMFRLGADQGVQFAVGFGGGAAIVGSVDYVWEFFQLTSIEPGHLGLYVGGGIFAGLIPVGYYYVGRPYYAGGSFPVLFGLEVPFGLRWRFHRLPVDIFGEIAPTISVFPGLGFGFKGSLGARFYF